MKKEDRQNSKDETGGEENKNENKIQQKNQTTNISNPQQDNLNYRAGLGRERMIDIEDFEGRNARDDYAGGDNDDLSNEDLNASNDQ